MEDKEDNELLARVLEALSLLVKYGYYNNPDDVEKVLEPLVEVMNGFTDRVSSASSEPIDFYTQCFSFANSNSSFPSANCMEAMFPAGLNSNGACKFSRVCSCAEDKPSRFSLKSINLVMLTL